MMDAGDGYSHGAERDDQFAVAQDADNVTHSTLKFAFADTDLLHRSKFGIGVTQDLDIVTAGLDKSPEPLHLLIWHDGWQTRGMIFEGRAQTINAFYDVANVLVGTYKHDITDERGLNPNHLLAILGEHLLVGGWYEILYVALFKGFSELLSRFIDHKPTILGHKKLVADVLEDNLSFY